MTSKTLRDYRHAAGLTATELAARLGVGEQTIYRWERGDKQPRKAMLLRLAAVLDEPATEIAAALLR